MPTPNTAHPDLREYWEKAFEAERGIRIPCVSKAECNALRMRLNRFRVALRKESLKIYPESHPMRGRTVFDALIVRIEDDRFVRIEKEPTRLVETL